MKQVSHTIDTYLVPQPVEYLKSLRKNDTRESLFQAITVGAAFVEELGLLWFRRELNSKGVSFQWKDRKDGYPYLQMSQILALLNSIGLIDDKELATFQKSAGDRNRLVHRMYSQWEKDIPELGREADAMIGCVETILVRSKLKTA